MSPPQVQLDGPYHVSRMADLAHAALYPIDLLFAGIPCPDFSASQTVGADTKEARWGGFDEFVEMVASRAAQGILDASVLLENVPRFVTVHMTPEKLDELQTHAGMHVRLFTVPANSFGCGTRRERTILVGFRDPRHLDAFGQGPKPTSTTSAPLSQFIDPEYNNPMLHEPLFLETRELMHGLAAAKAHQVVSPASTEPLNVRTRSNSPTRPSGTGGTFVCVHPSVAQQLKRLTDQQLEGFKTWFDVTPAVPIMRRLHPREELRAMGWAQSELPGFASRADRRSYEWVADSLCPPVFEAFVARMVWAMGKTLPSGVTVMEAAPEDVKRKSNPQQVEYFKMKAPEAPGGITHEE